MFNSIEIFLSCHLHLLYLSSSFFFNLLISHEPRNWVINDSHYETIFTMVFIQFTVSVPELVGQRDTVGIVLVAETRADSVRVTAQSIDPLIRLANRERSVVWGVGDSSSLPGGKVSFARRPKIPWVSDVHSESHFCPPSKKFSDHLSLFFLLSILFTLLTTSRTISYKRRKIHDLIFNAIVSRPCNDILSVIPILRFYSSIRSKARDASRKKASASREIGKRDACLSVQNMIGWSCVHGLNLFCFDVIASVRM